MESDDDVVISGVSGRLPESANVEQFLDQLFDGVDMLTVDDRRYPPGIWGTPERCGKIPEVDRFDAGFFGIHPKLANFMDPRHKILLETAYESIVDAGYNPTELRGSRTGVYVGLSAFSNPEELKRHETNGYTNMGLSLALAANRVSYAFDLRGPSYIIDSACSSSTYAFANALRDIRLGETDSALVCGAHLIIHPHETMEFDKLNMLAADGTCKVFSSKRDGYARSEAVVSVLLQRRASARRAYATVLGARLNADGYKPHGITLPSAAVQATLARELYSSIGVDPDDVAYVEAHGTGTPAGDVEECECLVDVFCGRRTTPLPIGSVKSNMGHSEMASGLCSVLKVIGMMERGVVPPNLHVEPLDTTLPGIRDGKLRVVTEAEPWSGGIVAVNSFGFGGANAHIALRSHSRAKRTRATPTHRLVLASGRTEEAVGVLLDGARAKRHDADFLALLDEVHKMNVDGHLYRGFEVLGESPAREVSKYSKGRPVWFVYAGMGSQWVGMGRDLLKFDAFRSTFERCAATLLPYGIDVMDVVTTDRPDVFGDIANCFAAIGACAIALTDLLFSLGVRPDGFLGHSLGEVFCAYADGAVTAEEAILLAYARAHACITTEMPPGRMAAVGLSKSAVEALLPDGIYVACENGAESVTVSGPKLATEAFVDELRSRGVFARAVESADIAFHTRYIMDAGERLREFVAGVLKTEQRPRSPRWVSSSVPEEMAALEWTRRNSPEYHRNNFCNPVLFRQALDEVPRDAVVVEVAPHGLLQAILKRELGPDVTCISLANRNCGDNEQFLLSAVGRIYNAGHHPQVRRLLSEPVDFPVAVGTAALSSLVRWDHSARWMCHLYRHPDRFGADVTVDLRHPAYSYLAGHDIDGRVLMPATGYLEIVWRTLAGLMLREPEHLGVVFEDVKFRRATVLPHDGAVEFHVNVMRPSGNFEISEGGSVVVVGRIRVPRDVSTEFTRERAPDAQRDSHLLMRGEDVYKEARLRGYRYAGAFVGVTRCDVRGERGALEWRGKFDAFIDAMMHLAIVAETRRDLQVPVAARRVVVDAPLHLRLVGDAAGGDGVEVFYDCDVDVIRSGGVEIAGLEFATAPQRQHRVGGGAEPRLAAHRFVPFVGGELDDALRVAAQIVLENLPGQVKRVRLHAASGELAAKVEAVLRSEPMVELEATTSLESCDLAVLAADDVVPETVVPFVLLLGGPAPRSPVRLETVFESGEVRLLKPPGEDPVRHRHRVVRVRSTDFDWLEKVKIYSGSGERRTVYLYAQDEGESGVLGLVRCLRLERADVEFRAVVVEGAPVAFSVEEEFYRGQLGKGLAFNVFREGAWGTYVHVPIEEAAMEPRESASASVAIGTVGDLSTLGWREARQRPDDEHLVDVHYAALNFKDIMVATGRIAFPRDARDPTAPDVQIGVEFAGTTRDGRRTMGLLGHGAMALQVTADPEFSWEVPDSWSLEEAATVPCVYATCYYALFVRGHIRRGDSILIHAGSGGIGMAAITIALAVGCEVYTTVGSKEKRDYLLKTFPSLPPENIGDSRSTSFERTVLERTRGRGVDYVLNSLSEELFRASLRCVARRGTFLEIGKFDMMNSTPIDSKLFMRNCSFHGVLLDDFFGEDSDAKSRIRDLLDEGIRSGVVRPLPRTVFPAERLEDAFRYLSAGKHKGKVLIRLGSQQEDSIPRSLRAEPALHFDPGKSYVVVGGLGGFGLELADWMIRRGATRLLLNSRREPSNGYQSYCLRKWSQYRDVVVEVSTDDTTHLVGAERVVRRALDLGGPVGGVFSLGMSLRDGLVVNQDAASFAEAFAPKIVSARNLDAVTRRSCPHLEHFVAFSSMASGRGNRGQANYAMANSAMERLCERRRRDGLPALAVQWGPIGDVGVLTKVAADHTIFNYLQLQPVRSCLECLERLMLQRRDAVVSSHVLADVDAATPTQATSRTPASAVAHILGLKDYGSVDASTTLAQLGLDSLMLSEIKQTLYRNHQLDLGPDEIRELTFARLIAMDKEGAGATSAQSEASNGGADYIAQREIVVRLRSADPEEGDAVVFLVHSIEGTVAALRPLAARLRATVYGLQCAAGCRFDSMAELAAVYLREVRRVRPTGPYLLGGYSFGAAVAFEMALQAEREGDEAARLVLVDGSPAYVRASLSVGRRDSDEDSVDAVLRAFAANFGAAVPSEEVVAALATSGGTEGKVAALGAAIARRTGVADEAAMGESIGLFLRRCGCGVEYEPASRLRSGEVTLVRVEGGAVDVSEDYGLQEVCERPVRVVKVGADHRTILGGEFVEEVAAIVNESFLGNKR